MASRNESRRLRTRPGDHALNLTPFLDAIERDLGHEDPLAIIDRYPHHDALTLCLPELAPDWAHTRPIQRRNDEYVINIPACILNQRDLEDAQELEYRDLTDVDATLTF